MLAGSKVAGEASDPLYGIYAYTAREWDLEINLYYYRARYYDAKIGRFISEDPIGFMDGPNGYTYGRNDPVGLVDPAGTQASSPKRKPPRRRPSPPGKPASIAPPIVREAMWGIDCEGGIPVTYEPLPPTKAKPDKGGLFPSDSQAQEEERGEWRGKWRRKCEASAPAGFLREAIYVNRPVNSGRPYMVCCQRCLV